MYLILAIPTIGKPFGRIEDPKGLDLKIAPGIYKHFEAAAELLTSGDFTNMALHDIHKPEHGVSEIFDHNDIDYVDRARDAIKNMSSKKSEAHNDKKNSEKPVADDNSTKDNQPKNTPPIKQKGRGKK